MAEVTGENLVEATLGSIGVSINALLQMAMSARVQSQIDAGVDSDTAVSVVMMGMAPAVNEEMGGNVLALSTVIGEEKEIIENGDMPTEEPIAPTEVELTSDTVGVDGEVEDFRYSIDSSSGEVISQLDLDIVLSGFSVGEDSLTFVDVASGIVTTETFVDSVIVSSSIISDLTDIIFAENVSGNAYQLTLNGIVDDTLSTVDMNVV